MEIINFSRQFVFYPFCESTSDSRVTKDMRGIASLFTFHLESGKGLA